MIRKVRTKVASKISRIEEVDDFSYSRWLKKPLLYEHPVDSIDSDLEDTSKLKLVIDEAENSGYKFVFLEPEVNDAFPHYSFPKVRSNTIFFMISVPLEKFVLYPVSATKKIKFNSRSFEFLLMRPSFRKMDVQFDNLVFSSYECTLPVPESVDYLKAEIPEVINIDLLGINNLVDATGATDVQIIKPEPFAKLKIVKKAIPELPKLKKIFKIKIPSAGKFSSDNIEVPIPFFSKVKSSDAIPIKFSRVKSYFANFKLERSNAFLLYTSSKDKASAEGKKRTGKAQSAFREHLKFILSHVQTVDWNKSKSVQIRLQDYEESAAKFLAENEFALLQDELGIDSEKEVIAALHILFVNQVVKSALILTSENKKGYQHLSGQLNINSGWIDKFNSLSPELSITLVEGNDQERTELWNRSSSIIVSTIENAINDHHFKTLTQKKLEKFDCIVIDNAHQVFSTAEKGKKFAESIKPKILWAVSNHLDENLQKELNDWLAPSMEIEKILVRSKESIKEQTTRFIWNECWVIADDSQAKEFKEQLTDCRKELKRVLESDNPLRFTANIYTLLHRLNQLSNFAPDKSTSPKIELLLEQISSIRANGKKVLVLSQYDRQGTKKLSEILTESGIKLVTVHSGTPVEDIKKSVSSFKSRKDLSVFIADSKIGKIKYADLGVSYVIKFDHWWNPINNWELEDMFYSDESSLKESINFLYYYTLSGIDQKVRELLSNGDLLNRNVFELMQTKVFEELITVDEWLKVFDMPLNEGVIIEPKPELILKQLNFLSADQFGNLLIKFFSTLGYSNLDILDSPDSSSFNIIGKARRGNRNFSLVVRVFLKPEVDQKTVEEILVDSSRSLNDKIFLITRSEFQNLSDDMLRDNVTFFDGLTLSKFLLRLQLVKVEA